jgi:hypothetical protein
MSKILWTTTFHVSAFVIVEIELHHHEELQGKLETAEIGSSDFPSSLGSESGSVVSATWGWVDRDSKLESETVVHGGRIVQCF